uniref:DNA-directed DNA polymerase n=1 Tax=Tanacetum cinerariifolium TaxID=118510 RepID=A0A6L2LCV0_TANCI|nr:DNA-directed DNA polymerase [Tanacetum cinerariifolium]
MQTRSSSRLTRDQTSNPTSSTNTTPKGSNRRSSKQKVENSNLEEHLHPVVTMADNRTMAEMLRAPTEGYAEAIVVPLILTEQFELKHRAARRWLEKEPPRSITMWEDLVSKFINEFFPPSRTTSLRDEILKFQQKFDESFHEAWDRYKDLLRVCPHHGFTELHQLNTFYNALNPADQDSLNATAGGNLLERSTQDVLTIIENKSKVRNSQSKPIPSQVKACDTNSNSEIAKLTHAVNQQTSAMTTAITAMLKQFQATPPLAPVKAVEEICATCGGAHPYYQCVTAGGNTFPEFRDNIQGYVSAATVNYNQGSGFLPSNTVANPKGELEAITTRSAVPTPPKSITPKVDERVEETYTDPDLTEYTIKVPPPLQEKDEVQIQIFWQMFKQLHINITLADALVLMPKYQKMLKALLSNMEKLQELANTPLNENFSAVILKKLPEKLGDPGKFLISCGFSELKCKALADLGASINLMPLSVWKELGSPELIPTRMTLKLANRAICTPAGIARDVFVPVGKFTFPADFVIVDYESDPRVPLILGRPLLRIARALIDVHCEEMILRDGDERLTLNMRHGTSSYSNQPQRESVNLIYIFNVSSEDFLEDLFLHQLSGNPTFLPHPELTSPKEFTDELALITYPLEYDDNLQFDIESDLKEIEFRLHQDKDSSLKDSIDQKDLANLDDIFIDPVPEMFTDEHAPDYSSPLIFDVYDDDFLEVDSDAKNAYDDPFDSKEEKIKEFKLLIDELDLPCDFLPPSEYDSFNSQAFSRVDALPSTNNEDKVFNLDIFIQEKPVKIITRVTQDKKLAISNASLVLEDFDPPFYEPFFFKDVPKSKMLLQFSSENEEKVFKPGIYTFEKVKENKENDKIGTKPDKSESKREA